MKPRSPKTHDYRRLGLIARPVWVEPQEAQRVRRVAEQAGITQQEWMRRAFVRALVKARPQREGV